METNNFFQNQANQNYGNMNWTGQNNMNVNQQPYYNNFVSRPVINPSNNIPVRVVFSPEQIAPQEIPTNGTPALFPLSDGSKIIARSLAGSGLFEERIYVLQPQNVLPDDQNKVSEFDQVMTRLGNIEESLNRVLNDLYGSKSQSSQEGGTE